MRKPTDVSAEVKPFLRLGDPGTPTRRGFLKGSLGSLLLPAFSAPWLVSCGENPVAPPPTPRLTSVNNFRDVAGADDEGAYRTSSGRNLQRGVIYRSSVLDPSPTDLATLNTLGIVADYDLRTPGEIALVSDILPTGAIYRNINIAGTAGSPSPTSLASADDAIAFMEAAYAKFVADSGIRGRFAEVLQKLAAVNNGSQVYHCTGGKDRTGWTTAILLSVLGVPRNVIIEDYLLTNIYSAVSIQASYQQMIAVYGQAYADIHYPISIADPRYLDAALNQVAASYGTMANFISQGLGLSSALQTLLCVKLLT
jgi:protein tyrosine/serine phosphatase